MKALLPLIGVLLVLAISAGIWLVIGVIVALGVGPAPYAILIGVSLSRHADSLCEARDKRTLRLPIARIR